MPSTSRLVYSTDHGRMCPDCGRPDDACSCRADARSAVPQGDGTARIAYETQGRKGKGGTVVRGIPLEAAALAQLGKELRTGCGAGGTTKDGVIEIQGDHRDAVAAVLAQRGLAVKRVGG
ncbi:translation initiation factor Sui1 [Xylophilus sp.]|uniref:translation initiation factor Sui1 n=1 Tax=Xylophilus sp. TaxID=2653893 RepID=UPI0013B77F19|nr:translation initiation factor Sui1 [Xylophilus sp.]KAF1043888.1 MAG: putative protein YciH [Xylophilus sp.]